MPNRLVPLLIRHGDAGQKTVPDVSRVSPALLQKTGVADDLAGGVEAEDRFGGPGMEPLGPILVDMR
jgi:hypothetical protein